LLSLLDWAEEILLHHHLLLLRLSLPLFAMPAEAPLLVTALSRDEDLRKL
jgi:hypothetical protein